MPAPDAERALNERLWGILDELRLALQGEGGMGSSTVNYVASILARALRKAAEGSLDLEVAKLDLQPGDVVVIRSHRKLDHDQIKLIAEQLKAVLPKDVRAAVVDSEVSLEVIKAAVDEQSP